MLICNSLPGCLHCCSLPISKRLTCQLLSTHQSLPHSLSYTASLPHCLNAIFTHLLIQGEDALLAARVADKKLVEYTESTPDPLSDQQRECPGGVSGELADPLACPKSGLATENDTEAETETETGTEIEIVKEDHNGDSVIDVDDDINLSSTLSTTAAHSTTAVASSSSSTLASSVVVADVMTAAVPGVAMRAALQPELITGIQMKK